MLNQEKTKLVNTQNNAPRWNCSCGYNNPTYAVNCQRPGGCPKGF